MKAKLRLAALGIGSLAAIFMVYRLLTVYTHSSGSEDFGGGSPSGGGVHTRRLNQPRPFSWNGGEDTDVEEVEVDDQRANRTEDETSLPKTCRNTKQGKSVIADDRGYVCQRSQVVSSSGCCGNESSDIPRYFCQGCHMQSGCCGAYEHCVSCCMDPKHRSVLKDVLSDANKKSDILLMSVSDHFELCMAKCRTNSRSVQHENLYINPAKKYCFKLSPSPGEPNDNLLEEKVP